MKSDHFYHFALTSLSLWILIVSGGCEDPPLKSGTDWMPQCVAGRMEIRDLPPAHKLHDDYLQWVNSSTGSVARLYLANLQGSTNQLHFSFQVKRAESPIGRALTTFASFVYVDRTNGSYELNWMLTGRQNPDFIKLGAKPRKFLLKLIQTKDVSIPRLQIVAIEGVQRRGPFVATEDKTVP